MSNAAVMTARVTNGGSFDFLGAIASFFESFGAAIRVSNALSAHRRPEAEDLKVLGIDENAFDAVR
ncbi:hypothetical protein [Flaviflagellibacter deserti]|jgi:hypothetical protein|uniref:Uncharacterized protein n=1 Tax=Flaviflagellibacter deserti TaxID=2267266 RepID=A0ABV9Z1X6_9HYPH